jgi:acyl carrier protein phosphodiesterase
MNYLAHAYLSGGSDEVLIGNFIGDSVKGKQYLNYPAKVQEGILIHRRIDSFTDNHPLVKQCSQRFRQPYGRYAGIVTDVVFDHFLAKYWATWSPDPFPEFVKHVHSVLLSNFARLPIDVKGFLPFFIGHRRLESYARFDGIRETLGVMGRRTSLPDRADMAMQILYEEFFPMKAEFDAFFPQLIGFVEQNFAIQIKKPVTHRLWMNDAVI